MQTGALSGHTYGATTIPEEHLFVPKPGTDSEDEGWIIGTSLDFAARMAQAEAQLELVDGNIARTVIRAPMAGLVIEGDGR